LLLQWCCLLRIPLPSRPVPAVLGVDDFALRRRRRYASVVINATAPERVDVLPDRKSDTLAAWITEHPGVEIVVRDDSTTYAEAVRRSLPAATQVSDRWHLWHGLARATEKLVAAHSSDRAERFTAPASGTMVLCQDVGSATRLVRMAQPGHRFCVAAPDADAVAGDVEPVPFVRVASGRFAVGSKT
jgi:hypothetical protein